MKNQLYCSLATLSTGQMYCSLSTLSTGACMERRSHDDTMRALGVDIK